MPHGRGTMRPWAGSVAGARSRLLASTTARRRMLGPWREVSAEGDAGRAGTCTSGAVLAVRNGELPNRRGRRGAEGRRGLQLRTTTTTTEPQRTRRHGGARRTALDRPRCAWQVSVGRTARRNGGTASGGSYRGRRVPGPFTNHQRSRRRTRTPRAASRGPPGAVLSVVLCVSVSSVVQLLAVRSCGPLRLRVLCGSVVRGCPDAYSISRFSARASSARRAVSTLRSAPVKRYCA